MTDFHYTTDGLLASLIPHSPEAVAEYNRQPALRAKFLLLHLPAVRAQMRAAGYSLRISPPVRTSDEDLLAGLE